MRLLIVSQYFWPENFRINDLVEEFVKRGHQVTVLTGLPNYPNGKVFDQFKADPAQYSNYAGADIVRVPIVSRGLGGVRLLLNYLSFAASASFIGLWKLRGRHFDVIFTCQLSPITVGLPAAVMRTFKRAPMAFWVLDLWPESLHAIGVVRSPKVLQVVGGLVSFIYKRCDLILAQSKSFIPQIQKYAAKNSHIQYFPSWAETVFQSNSIILANEIPLKPGSFNIMFAGNIGDAQDFPAILAAAENLKSHTHIRWLIVGDGRMAKWVADEIQNRNLQNSVLMLGRHSIDRMPSFFKHADALLVSLKDEPIFAMTIPGKLQSYLASGIPVIAMLNGEGANLVASSAAGVTCAAGDHQGLSDAVLKLAGMSTEEREVLGRNGLIVSAHEFDRNALMDRIESLLVAMKAAESSR